MLMLWIDGEHVEVDDGLAQVLLTRTRAEAARAAPRMKCSRHRYNTMAAEVWLSSEYAPGRIRMMGQRKGPHWNLFEQAILKRLEAANQSFGYVGGYFSWLGKEDLEEAILASIGGE